jgi:hypothetical protein
MMHGHSCFGHFLIFFEKAAVFSAQRIAFYPSKLSGNQVAVIAPTYRQGDKPVLSLVEGTCWTKPWSSAQLRLWGFESGGTARRVALG